MGYIFTRKENRKCKTQIYINVSYVKQILFQEEPADQKKFSAQKNVKISFTVSANNTQKNFLKIIIFPWSS